MFRILPMLLLGLCVLSCSREPPPPAVPSSLAPESVARGRELVRGLAACGVCHGETPQPTSVLAGGRIIEDEYGSVTAPNITPAESGIGSWTDADVMRAFRASIGKDGEWLAGQVHRGYEWMSDEDAQAIVNYLRTLPPVEKELERRQLSFMDRNTKGFFDSRPEVSGFVPAIDRREVEAYGQYLTDHVARCGGCHNSPVSILRPEEYLAGGRVIRTDLGEKVAPAISSSKVYGLGDWSETAIVQYLKTGVGPDGGVSDAQFCPTGFFRNAAEEDLVAIARYLRTVPG